MEWLHYKYSSLYALTCFYKTVGCAWKVPRNEMTENARRTQRGRRGVSSTAFWCMPPNPYKLTTANKRQPIKSLPFSLVKPRCLLRSGTMSATRPFYSLCWAPTQVSLEHERRILGRSWGLAVIQSGRFSRIMLCNQVAYPIGFFWPPSI